MLQSLVDAKDTCYTTLNDWDGLVMFLFRRSFFKDDRLEHDVAPIVAVPPFAFYTEDLRIIDREGQHIGDAVQLFPRIRMAALKDVDLKIVLSVRIYLIIQL